LASNIVEHSLVRGVARVLVVKGLVEVCALLRALDHDVPVGVLIEHL